MTYLSDDICMHMSLCICTHLYVWCTHINMDLCRHTYIHNLLNAVHRNYSMTRIKFKLPKMTSKSTVCCHHHCSSSSSSSSLQPHLLSLCIPCRHLPNHSSFLDPQTLAHFPILVQPFLCPFHYHPGKLSRKNYSLPIFWEPRLYPLNNYLECYLIMIFYKDIY